MARLFINKDSSKLHGKKLGGSKQSHYDPFVNDKISVLLKIRLVNMAFLNPRRRSNAES